MSMMYIRKLRRDLTAKQIAVINAAWDGRENTRVDALARVTEWSPVPAWKAAQR